jgi:Cu(I)/Ag(I) efflux system membrane fusion protein
MKQGSKIAVVTSAVATVVAVAVVAGAGGYWLGQHGNEQHAEASHAASVGDSAKKERKVRFYRNPMGLPDTSPVPKKDPMGMDYIPVYEGEEEADTASAGQIKISADKVQKLGVRIERASVRTIERHVRAVGRIDPDERRVYAIAPKFEGYVERLHVNATGQPVAKGQPLFEVYSPELVSAQREYAIAAQGVQSLAGAGSEAQSGMKQLADSSLLRLRNWGISEEQIKSLASTSNTRRTMTYRSPVQGIVVEKKAVQGMRFMPGDTLYQVADLSSVWVLADVFEQDIGMLRPGAKASVTLEAYAGKQFEGTVGYIYPTMNAQTRTVPVRIELANPGGLLKPGMYAQVDMGVAAKSSAVSIPVSAVIDSGTRRIVLVELKEGRFEPREVKLGARSDDYVEVLAGVRDGEAVVVAANFLIDAESNLKAATGSFGNAPAASPDSTPAKAGAGHKTEGIVEAIDASAGTVTLHHNPVSTLNWPEMSMEFKLANTALLANLKAGARVAFEFVERQPGDWVITSIVPAATHQHAGH